MVCHVVSRERVCLSLFVIAIVFFGEISMTYAQESAKAGNMPSADKIAKSDITYAVVAAEGGGYGYDIFTDGRKLIHQPTIPGRPGTSGFRKESDAKKVAELVVRKLKKREIPPAVTEAELKKLKVID
jgi:hypothetical protein